MTSHVRVPFRGDDIDRHYVYQLTTGLPTESKDCGPSATTNAQIALSKGRVGPDDHQEDRQWILQTRSAAGNMTEPFFVKRDVEAVLDKRIIDAFFRAEGLTEVDAVYHLKLPWTAMKDELRKGNVVILAVDYGALNKGDAPSGDPDFRGDHYIVLAGIRTVNRRAYTNVIDSLFDGRRSGIPDGPQVVRLPQLRYAAQQFGPPKLRPGRGYCTCVVLKGGH